MALQKFIIERDIPKVGTFGGSNCAKPPGSRVGPDIQWVKSYVGDNKTFRVYLAKDEVSIPNHAEISGFPATKITSLKGAIDPTTAPAELAAFPSGRNDPNPGPLEIFRTGFANYPRALR